MIDCTTMYRITTGNLFGVSFGWPEAFHRSAMEIVKDANEDYDDHGYDANPAFAGAWIVVFDKSVADRIEKTWKQLLPLALNSMSPKWRKEYDDDLYKAKSRLTV